jgi:L-fuculokinase
MEQLVLVFDCGATNVRAIAVNTKGDIVHREARPNAPVRQEPGKDWLIWDIEAIWRKLLDCGRKTVAAVGKDKIGAVVVTAFSDDGAPVDDKGNLLYPVVSWQCPRTVDIANRIDDYIPSADLFRITGEQPMSQHTIFRLLWLKENAPKALERAHRYLMTPGILNFRLTGRMTNDPTTADSMMLLDIRRRDYSADLIGRLGLPGPLFAPLVEPGTVIGTLTRPVARRLGLPGNVPVVAAGHDTQFAIAGSGCPVGQAVLSSGTWEILFVRRAAPNLSARARRLGLKNECDAVAGLYDSGFQWIGSGALEWAADAFFSAGTPGARTYDRMIAEAEGVGRGAGGIMVYPSFIRGSGIARRYNAAGAIMGLTLQSRRGQIYRAFLEGLAFQLREALTLLGGLTETKFPLVTVVGGGSKNELLNRVRADVLDIPIRLTRQAENTVVGAAIFGFIGIGEFRDHRQALSHIDFFSRTVEPSPGREVYDDLYERFVKMGPAIDGIQG